MRSRVRISALKRAPCGSHARVYIPTRIHISERASERERERERAFRTRAASRTPSLCPFRPRSSLLYSSLSLSSSSSTATSPPFCLNAERERARAVARQRPLSSASFIIQQPMRATRHPRSLSRSLAHSGRQPRRAASSRALHTHALYCAGARAPLCKVGSLRVCGYGSGVVSADRYRGRERKRAFGWEFFFFFFYSEESFWKR